MINIPIFLEEMLIGFIFTFGVLSIFLSKFFLATSLIIIASTAYYLKRRRISNEQTENDKTY